MGTRILRQLILMSLVGNLIFGVAGATEHQQSEPDVIKVGGTYRVHAIKGSPNDQFTVVFRAVEASGDFDELVLVTDHVNFTVRKGAEVRLSAEVLKKYNDYAEVSQVVIFMPSPQGGVPVWMLSARSRAKDLRGTSYLKMHAPTTDYQIF